MTIVLSPTSLNLFENCPRCFYLQITKRIYRPGSPFPSIVNKMDEVIKNYCNTYRAQGVLPPLLARLPGKLAVGMPKSLYWFDKTNGVTFQGIPDEYLEIDGCIVPLDHKTKASPPTEPHPAYQLQMDCYSFLLEANKYKTLPKAYLAYYYPDDGELHKGMKLNCHILEITTNTDRVKELLEKAVVLLKGELPETGKECAYCAWIEERKEANGKTE